MAAPKVTLYSLTTTPLAIPATIPCRYVKIREDESVTPVGLTYQMPNDNFAASFTVGVPQGPNIPQIELGDYVSIQNGTGSVLGIPEQNPAQASAFNHRAADTIIKVAAKSSTTKIRVEEFS